MKDLDQTPIKVESYEIENQKKQYTLAMSLVRPHKNMILYCYDSDNETLEEAKMDSKIAMGHYGNIVKKNTVEKSNEKLLYVFALNRKNAQRKVNKALGIK